MEELTQTISNLVGILLGIVGAVGVGFFIYGVVELVMNAVVGSPVDPNVPDPTAPTPPPTPDGG